MYRKKINHLGSRHINVSGIIGDELWAQIPDNHKLGVALHVRYVVEQRMNGCSAEIDYDGIQEVIRHGR